MNHTLWFIYLFLAFQNVGVFSFIVVQKRSEILVWVYFVL